jgi:3',5'-cyclic AMP phosphodiesterase CpdA
MPAPLLLAQISDMHIGADWGGGDPEAGLAAAVAAVAALVPRPLALLVSGDLAEHATDGEYGRARELLERAGLPLHVLPGNHDARAPLRRHFRLPGAGAEPAQHVAELAGLRLVALDSTRPGADDGALDGGRLDWLEDALAGDRATPTVLALHHPPLVSGLPAMDAIGLAADDRDALAAIVARHPQVLRIVAGHFHRPIAGALAGRTVTVAPSSYLQSRLDLTAAEIALTDEPPAIAVHVLTGGAIATHVQTVARS